QNQSRAAARSKILAISLILVVSFVSLLAVRPVAATAETGYENPVTAAPQLVPPTTASCTFTLAQSQPFPVPGGNGYDTPFTGTIYMTATLTFYDTSPTFPAASHPDTIVPLSGSFLFLFGRTPVSPRPVTLPTNPDRVYLEMWAKGNSCDEFWYASQPDAYANANGLCGGGAFREIEISIDGTLAGVVWPFPYVFTGGINAYLWRPIPAV